MKKLMILGTLSAAITMNSCNSNSGKNSDGDKNSPNHVEQHSGEEITPQAEINSDSSRLKIDTISSAESSDKQKDSV